MPERRRNEKSSINNVSFWQINNLLGSQSGSLELIPWSWKTRTLAAYLILLSTRMPQNDSLWASRSLSAIGMQWFGKYGGDVLER